MAVRRFVALLAAVLMAAMSVGQASASVQASGVIASFQGRSWRGDLGTPSDQTGAIGPDRYFELTNSGYRIFTRCGAQIASGTARKLAQITDPDTYAFDVQVNWDPSTQRFYFAAIQSRQPAPNFPFLRNRLVFGFSKNAAPSSASDFCVYRSTFGTYGDTWFPDFPKLGTSGDFILMGVNAYHLPNFGKERTDLAWVAKPPAGSACPRSSDLRQGIQKDLRDPNNPDPAMNQLFTPVPGQRYVSGDSAGWVVATPASIFGPQGAPDAANQSTLPAPSVGSFPQTHASKAGIAKQLFVLKVTRNGDGSAQVNPAVAIAVPRYTFPPNAPQLGTDQLLDTHDARFTQAVLSFDPTKNRLALWTQHAVFGGAGSEIRWYEIDVNGASILRSGRVSDPNLWFYNAAISSDRVVNGNTEAYGGGYAIGFNSSSATEPLRIQMMSQGPTSEPSPIVTIKTTLGPAIDGSCEFYGYCRWGDYSGATPDPLATVGRPGGAVWFTNGYSQPGAFPTRGHGRFWWTTWNWGATVG
jgi:hypothetical protein